MGLRVVASLISSGVLLALKRLQFEIINLLPTVAVKTFHKILCTVEKI